MQKHNDWFFIAEHDLLVAKLIANHPVVLLPAFYLAQQCAEKALKGYLVHRKQTIRKTHDLVELTKHCMHLDKSFETLFDESTSLNPYVTKFRYPDLFFVIPDKSE